MTIKEYEAESLIMLVILFERVNRPFGMCRAMFLCNVPSKLCACAQAVRWAHIKDLERTQMFFPRMCVHIFHTCRFKYRWGLVKCCRKEILCVHRLLKIRGNIGPELCKMWIGGRVSQLPGEAELADTYIQSFIHSGYLYSASSSPLLLGSVPDTARILCRSFVPKRHRQLRVKGLPKVPTWQSGFQTHALQT